jgi:hypothetical protein
MDEEKLEDILAQWKHDHLPLVASKSGMSVYRQLSFGKSKEKAAIRLELLTILIHMIKEELEKEEDPYGEDYFNVTIKKLIIKSVTPKGKRYDNTEAGRNWREGTMETLREAIKSAYSIGKSKFELKPVELAVVKESTSEPKVIKKPHDPSKYNEKPIVIVENEELLEFFELKKQ